MGPFCGPQHPITEPPHLQTFLCTKIKSWYLVCILFIKNGMQWYAYVWANTPKGRETALTLGRRPHFFVYRDRKLKFVMNIVHTKWSTMICCMGSFPQGPCSGPCVRPNATLFFCLLRLKAEIWYAYGSYEIEYIYMHMCGLTPSRAAKRPCVGTIDPLRSPLPFGCWHNRWTAPYWLPAGQNQG